MTDVRPTLGAALSDRYRIERELGAGGMATVYLAHDVKHDRKVAIKVLKPELAAVLGAERFVVEIRTTAALQHPHILPLFDSGEAGGFLYYVMPYIEGETIREKLNRETQFGVDEAIRIAREVADALDYAHRHGVIHRDIKPENILLHDGRAMVMDFGIALAVSAAAGGRMTETGLSLGTPHYMSPEQATAEKQITARSDIYSLASVLYEMLAGQPPHVGGSAQQVIMKIITEAAAPVNAMRKNVPPNVVDALDKALEKLPADRFESAHEFAEALVDPIFLATHRSSRIRGQPTLDARSWLRDVRSRIALAVIAGLAVLTFTIRALRPPAAAMDQTSMVTRLSFSPGDRIVGPPRGGNGDRPSRTAIAISPDGKTLVFVGTQDSVPELFTRPLNGESATPIPGTEGAESPFFSPDGLYVGYWSRQRLMRVPIAGGQPSQIAAIGRISGASWSHGDKIVVGVEDVGLIMLSTNGASQPDTLAGRGSTLPQFLPGESSILFTRRTGGNGNSGTPFAIEAITIKGRKRTSVLAGADARYAPTGHIVFGRNGTLFAAPFDASRLAVTGTPVVVLDDVMQALNGSMADVHTGAVQLAISPLGHLVYLSGGVTPDRSHQLVWLDRQGRATAIGEAGVRPFFAVRLSPDERQAAITTLGRHPEVLIFDVARKTLLTLADTGFQLWPLWSPDGLHVVHRTASRDSASLGWSLADGSRPATPFTTAAITKADPAFWSPDGKQLFVRSEPDVGRLSRVTLADGHISDVANLPADEQSPVLSPDGKWIAYDAGEGGATPAQVFVQPWPALDRRWKISTDGGFDPVWTRDGRELVYLHALAPDSTGTRLRVMAADVGGGATLSPQMPHELFTAPFWYSSPLRAYDVTKDGSRFLVTTGSSVHAPAGEPRMIVNWFSDLRRLSAARGAATP